jgi:hypothetical protein
MTTNSSHYVPRLLLKGWSFRPSKARSERERSAWVYDRWDEIVGARDLTDLCCLPADKDTNDSWNKHVEIHVTNPLKALRNDSSQATPNPVSVTPVRGFQPKSVDVLFHFFWAFRSRHPDTPRDWGGFSESEYIGIVENPKEGKELLTYLHSKYQLALLRLRDDGALPLALSDYTVFPLKPIDRRAVLCLPITPRRALLMVDKRIRLTHLERELTPIDLGEVSHGTPGNIIVLDPSRNWADPCEQDAIIAIAKSAKLKWQPIVAGEWSSTVDLSS